MLATIMRNFLSNAIKFTESHGNVTIRVQDAGDWVKITVSDTGIGIKEEDLKKLFRLDLIHSTLGTAREKGTGLGLILCKEFVETHGGKILVKSNVGNGSHFTFTLPKSNQPQHHEKKQ